MRGKIKFYINDKAYGFITQEDGTDIFFHVTGVVEKDRHHILPDVEVTYEVEQGKKGPQAVNVSLV